MIRILLTSGVYVRELRFLSRNTLKDFFSLLDSITEELLEDRTESSGWLS